MKNLYNTITQLSAKKTITWFVSATIFFSAFLFLPPIYFSWILRGICVWILLFEWPVLAKKSWALWLCTPFYIIIPFSILVILNESARSILLFLFVSVISFDTGAYIFGTIFGKNKIWPSVSPKKTWEGFFGGWLCTCGAITFPLLFTNLSSAYGQIHIGYQMLVAGIMSLCIATIATIGDFFESWLKRRVNLKDSGSLLPGHGGLLDRFDGILTTSYFIYTLKILFI